MLSGSNDQCLLFDPSVNEYVLMQYEQNVLYINYSGTQWKILQNSVTVQDFSFALFEFFPSQKLAVTEHDHMRLTLRAMFIACASTDCNMAKVVTFDNPTNINDESGMLSAIAERGNRSGYPERSGK